MSAAQSKTVIEDLAKLGFRRSHVEEAAEICKDREETLEWLLIHVPEDDIPRWALPESYSAGITVGNMDIKKEAAVKRLSESGYALDLCARIFEETECNESKAAEMLPNRLLGRDETELPKPEDVITPGTTVDEVWEDEVVAMECSFGELFTKKSPDVIQMKLESVINGPKKDVETLVQVRKSPSYPAQLVITIHSQLPAQVKLSVIKQTLAYLDESYREDPMKVFVAVDWIRRTSMQSSKSPASSSKFPRSVRRRPRRQRSTVFGVIRRVAGHLSRSTGSQTCKAEMHGSNDGRLRTTRRCC